MDNNSIKGYATCTSQVVTDSSNRAARLATLQAAAGWQPAAGGSAAGVNDLKSGLFRSFCPRLKKVEETQNEDDENDDKEDNDDNDVVDDDSQHDSNDGDDDAE